MDSPDGCVPVFGDSDEWQRFFERHRTFFETFGALNDTIRKTLIREFEVDSADKEVVHFLGRLTIEDFMEILLLSGNGYGIGALKILRGQYERTVTAAYIAKHPASAQRFVDYGNIQYGRMLNHAKRAYGRQGLEEILSPGKITEIEQAYSHSKDSFKEPLCKSCGTTRTSFSWSELDTASMALKSGYGLERLYHHAYMIPTQQAHATVLSLLTRIKRDTKGSKYFDPSPQHEEADAALSTAHCLMLTMLKVQNDFFHLGLDQELGQRNEEYVSSTLKADANEDK